MQSSVPSTSDSLREADTKFHGAGSDAHALLQGRLMLFLQQSRNQAAQNHAMRMSLLESQYSRRLREVTAVRHVTSPLPCTPPEQPEVGRCAPTSCDAVGTDVVIEVDMSETDEEGPSSSVVMGSGELRRQRVSQHISYDNSGAERGPAGTTVASFSPQSPSASYDISPETRTPISPTTERKSPEKAMTTSDSVSTTMRGRSEVKYCGAAEALLKSSQVIPRRNVLTNRASVFPSRGTDRGGVSVSLMSAINNASEEAMRHRLMAPNTQRRDAARHQSVARSPGSPRPRVDASCPSSPTPLDPELMEFLVWEATRPEEYRRSLQAGLNRLCPIARAYAAARPEAGWLSHTDGEAIPVANERCRSPLHPGSTPSRFVEWIASDIDCYEDLLLEQTA
uniref:Uncharacterized protein n=1 Tax=Trypanosoma congolense (strain IL3000) TaxID=1068625 RepID=G0UYW8_TRYCI|nr:conserved hypothetical protein [Trypanosoma congolense IL3000]